MTLNLIPGMDGMRKVSMWIIELFSSNRGIRNNWGHNVAMGRRSYWTSPSIQEGFLMVRRLDKRQEQSVDGVPSHRRWQSELQGTTGFQPQRTPTTERERSQTGRKDRPCIKQGHWPAENGPHVTLKFKRTSKEGRRTNGRSTEDERRGEWWLHGVAKNQWGDRGHLGGDKNSGRRTEKKFPSRRWDVGWNR